MNLLDINESQIKSLSKISLNLTHFWLLHLLYNAGVAVYIPQIKERKLLQDRGLINDKEILPAGKIAYEQIRDTKLELSKSKKPEIKIESKFQEFWKTYPGSANFSYRGMKFTSSRVLKSNSPICEMLYNKAIATGTITEDQIIAATKYMVEQAMIESYDTGINKLQYLPGVEPFLRQEKYLGFVEIAEEINDSDPGDLYCA